MLFICCLFEAFYTRLSLLFRFFFSSNFPERFISFTRHLATKKVKKIVGNGLSLGASTVETNRDRDQDQDFSICQYQLLKPIKIFSTCQNKLFQMLRSIVSIKILTNIEILGLTRLSRPCRDKVFEVSRSSLD